MENHAMNHKKIINHFIALLLIGVIGMLVFNQGIFLHTHKLGDGKVIVHAHPYKKTEDTAPFKSHHHTKAEILFFYHIELLFPLFFLVFILFPLCCKFGLSVYPMQPYRVFWIHYIRGRAPPVFT
jgi:hypothetical protein